MDGGKARKKKNNVFMVGAGQEVSVSQDLAVKKKRKETTLLLNKLSPGMTLRKTSAVCLERAEGHTTTRKENRLPDCFIKNPFFSPQSYAAKVAVKRKCGSSPCPAAFHTVCFVSIAEEAFRILQVLDRMASEMCVRACHRPATHSAAWRWKTPFLG